MARDWNDSQVKKHVDIITARRGKGSKKQNGHPIPNVPRFGPNTWFELFGLSPRRDDDEHHGVFCEKPRTTSALGPSDGEHNADRTHATYDRDEPFLYEFSHLWRSIPPQTLILQKNKVQPDEQSHVLCKKKQKNKKNEKKTSFREKKETKNK